jgi:hypothetical protein
VSIAMMSLYFAKPRRTTRGKAQAMSAICGTEDTEQLKDFLDELILGLIQTRRGLNNPFSDVARGFADKPVEQELMEWLKRNT